jgi:membrane protease subunit (stomatin/prohibitin family)
MKLLSRIVYEGNTDTVVWKHPDNYFRSGAELIVPFTHEAIIIYDGQAGESFKPGKHIINADTVFISALFRRKQAQKLEIYYINKSVNLPIKWGTRTHLDLFDPVLKIPVRIGAHGEFEIKIDNPRKFLIKVVGNSAGMTKSQIQDFFRDKMGLYVKSAIADAMIGGNISYYEMSSRIKHLSEVLHMGLKDEFINYGAALESFIIASVVIPEGIKNELEKAFLAKAKENISQSNLNIIAEKAVKIDKIEEDLIDKAATTDETVAAKCPECGDALDKNNKCKSCGIRAQIEDTVPVIESESDIYAET